MKKESEELIRFLYRPVAFVKPERVIAPLNWAGHLPFAFWVVEALRPKRFVELGTHAGLSYCGFCQVIKRLNLATQSYAVDTWKGDPQAGFYDEQVYHALSAYHEQHYAGFSRLVRSTFDEALTHFADGSVDLLHIDGYHTYEAVEHDFRSWLPKLSKSGVVLLHDINVHERDFGAWKLWEEQQQNYPSIGFLHDHGLGVIGVGPEQPESMRWLFNAAADSSGETLSAIRQFFVERGLDIHDRFAGVGARQELQSANQRSHQLSEELTAKTGELFLLKSELQRLEIHKLTANNFRNENVSLQDELTKADLEIEHLRGELKRLVQSRSWKLTKPIRAASKITAKAAQLVRGSRRTAEGGARESIARSAVSLKNRRLIERSGLFDAKYYCAKYDDVLASGVDPLSHYMQDGATEGRNPNAFFVGKYYLTQYPEVATSGVNPLVHFLRFGVQKGYNPSPYFDTAFYLAEYNDVAQSRVNPLQHFLKHGLQEGRVSNRNHELPYEAWVDLYASIGEGDRKAIRRKIRELRWVPQFTLLLPLSSYPAELLSASIGSILKQLYQNWELIIILDRPLTVLAEAAMSAEILGDKRVKVIQGEDSDTQAELLRSALSVANGDYVSVINPISQLTEHALFLTADLLNRRKSERRETALIYGDEDTVTLAGMSISHNFKPDWNQTLFYSTDYLGDLKFIRGDLIKQLGDTGNAFEQAFVYDLVLRLIERIEPEEICHIPRVLVHQTILSDTESTTEPFRGSANTESVQALAEHLERVGNMAKVILRPNSTHGISYALPEPLPLVSLIVPTRDRLDLLQPCLTSLLEKTSYKNFELLVIDNGSEKEETFAFFEELRQRPNVMILSYPHPFNYSAINNFGVRHARGSILGFVNNDVEAISPEWLTALVEQICVAEIGIVGSKLYYPDGTIQHAGVVIGKNGLAGHSFAKLPLKSDGYNGRAILTQELSAVTAACMLVKKEIFDAAKGFDEEAFAVSFNDIDLCLKVRELGKKVLFVPAAELIHHECASRGEPSSDANRTNFEREFRTFVNKWERVINADPFYNPNLSLGSKDYSLATPPRVARDWFAGERSGESGDRHHSRDPRLNPYGGKSNLERSIEIQLRNGKETQQQSWKSGLSVIILNLNRPEYICPLIESLVKAQESFSIRGDTLQIIIGDTGSTDKAVLDTYARYQENITVVENLSYHFSRCNNLLFKQHARCDKTVFLNNDIIFDDAVQSLSVLCEALDRQPEIGIAGCHLFYPDGTMQHSGIDFFATGPFRSLSFHRLHGQRLPLGSALVEGVGVDVPAVTGACLLIRSALFMDVGGFDEAYNAECQDVALCQSVIRLGLRCKLIYAGRIVHIENGTRDKGSEDWGDRQRFVRKWGTFVEVQHSQLNSLN